MVKAKDLPAPRSSVTSTTSTYKEFFVTNLPHGHQHYRPQRCRGVIINIGQI